MKYNANFIRAIALLQQHDGDHAAEQLFKALFQPQTAAPLTRTRSDLLIEARERSKCASLYGSDIREINRQEGTPSIGWSCVVPWIKAARNNLGCGIKEAKDLHDFVRDNPEVSNA